MEEKKCVPIKGRASDVYFKDEFLISGELEFEIIGDFVIVTEKLPLEDVTYYIPQAEIRYIMYCESSITYTKSYRKKRAETVIKQQ